jgi:hypothetical protein
MNPSPELSITAQKTDSDCTIACLATFMGIDYEKVLEKAEKIACNPRKRGMFMTEIRRVAKMFKVKLKPVRKVNFEKDEGILSVDNYGKGWRTRKSGKPAGHVVVVWQGLIFDLCGQTVSTPAQYIRINKPKFGLFLRLEKP